MIEENPAGEGAVSGVAGEIEIGIEEVEEISTDKEVETIDGEEVEEIDLKETK